jgi:putative transposase
MSDLERVKWAGFAWAIENYHRGIKQFRLSERAQVRSRRAWRNHINLCLRAFLRLESHCYHRGGSWYEAKTSIIREAVRALTSQIHSIRSSQLRNFYHHLTRRKSYMSGFILILRAG